MASLPDMSFRRFMSLFRGLSGDSVFHTTHYYTKHPVPGTGHRNVITDPELAARALDRWAKG